MARRVYAEPGMSHPSGRPIRNRVVKRTAEPTGTSPGYYNARLNKTDPDERPGGMGFVIYSQEPEDDDSDVGAYPTTAKGRSH